MKLVTTYILGNKIAICGPHSDLSPKKKCEPKYNYKKIFSLKLTGRNSKSLGPRFVHTNRTLNPFKHFQTSEFQTCPAWNRPNFGPNPEKLNFKLFGIQFCLLKLNFETTWTLKIFYFLLNIFINFHLFCSKMFKKTLILAIEGNSH